MMQITKREKNGRIAKGSNLKHGLSDHRVYDTWIAMKARCNNKQHPNYHQYGARGISVCDEWHDFKHFIEDMGVPNRHMTLDRIDNDKGYSKENCRWITIQEQQKNRSNNNEFPGVAFEKSRNKWRADICRGGKRIFLGRFKELSDARAARIKAEQEYS